jgi:hypothetical protein
MSDTQFDDDTAETPTRTLSGGNPNDDLTLTLEQAEHLMAHLKEQLEQLKELDEVKPAYALALIAEAISQARADARTGDQAVRRVRGRAHESRCVMASTTPHLATATDAKRLASRAKKLKAAQATVLELTTRMKQIERTLRGLVTSQALTDAQRNEILGLVTGTRSRRRLSPHMRGTVPSKNSSSTTAGP